MNLSVDSHFSFSSAFLAVGTCKCSYRNRFLLLNTNSVANLVDSIFPTCVLMKKFLLLHFFKIPSGLQL